MISAAVRSPWSRLSLLLLVASGSHLWLYGLTELTPTVSLVELEWSLSALVGVLYSLDFLRDNLADWRLLVGPQEAECLVIEILILIAVVLLGLHLLLLSLGLLAMTSPPSVALPTLRIKFTAVGFTMTGQGMVLILMVIRAKRHRLRQLNGSSVL